MTELDSVTRDSPKPSETPSVALPNGSRDTESANGMVSFRDDDPVVIVGMACHLPGDVYSPSDFWKLLVEQKSAQSSVPKERYNIEGYYHPAGGKRSGSTNVPGGYFINRDVREFDNGFFGINNLEATYMDPQQRKLLEVAYEALQNSGTTMESVSGSTTGVYVANFSVDYQPGQTRDPDYIHRYTATGSGATIMSNRISHVLNLNGPSLTVDTACSSSIFALHQALNAISMGDCDSAIVASANLILSPELHIGAAMAGVLSPTGTSHTFDVSADGYGRAEGVNAIYVKRLSAALRDGNPVRAVIRGSAVNASGRTPGISLPSGKLQEVVMRKAYRDAGLDFADTDYVECHGTGTPVGDPIEVDAVGRCFARPGTGPPLLIGSVKTNVGHSEAASGLTSILKVVQSFENGRIAPTYGVKKINPKLILEERNIKIATEMEEWPRALRRASVNSFGYGGANGHLILESPESYLGGGHPSVRSNGLPSANHVNGNGVHINGTQTNGVKTNGKGGHPHDTDTNGTQANGDSIEAAAGEKQPLVLPVSAASAKSLKQVAEKLLQMVTEPVDKDTVRDLAHTLTKGRDALRHRNYLLAAYDETLGGYTATAAEIFGNVGNADTLPFGFVFTGQGAQYPGMGKELLSHSAHFRDTIRSLDEILQTLSAPYKPSWTLEQTLLDEPNTSKINEVTRSQPICTAIQIALVDLLRSWGVKPTSVVGHSSGEIGAAYAAGLINSSQAILIAYFRGYAVGELKSKGRMMAAGLDAESARSLIQDKGLQGQVRVACVNSPQSVTISGSLDGVEALYGELQSQQKFSRKLETGERAYHSHMMEEVGQLYEELLMPLFHKKDKTSSVQVKEEEVKMYSSVGHSSESVHIVESQTLGASYWRQNLEQPVQFNAALSSLAEDYNKIHLIEIGPHSALKGPIQQTRKAIGLDEKSLPYSSTLVRKESASLQMVNLAGILFTHGYALSWDKVNGLATGEKPRIAHTLAPYPWDYSGDLLWSEPRVSVELRNRKHIRHELLGTAALTGNGIDYTWRNILRPGEMPWIKDHKLEEQVVFPAAAYLAVAIEALSQIAGIKKELREGRRDVGFELRNVNISTALNIPDENDASGKDLELHTTMSPRKISGANVSANWHDFSISSLYWTSNIHTVHCTGSIRMTERKQDDCTTTKVQNTEGFDLWASTAKWYSKWHEEGLCFGPQFQSVKTLRTDSARKRCDAIATAKIEPELVGGSYEYYPVHPITIDSGLQAACLSGASGHVAALRTWLPVFIAEAHIQPPTRAASDEESEIHVKSEAMGFSSKRIDGTIRDSTGNLVVDFKDSRIALYSGSKSVSSALQPEGSDTLTTADDPMEKYLQRQPTLRIHWRPDLQRLGGPNSKTQLLGYLSEFLDKQHPDLRDDESLAVVGGLLELAGHKTPRMRVLEIGGDAQGYKAGIWQSILGKQTAYSLVRSWHNGTVDEKGKLSVEDEVDGPFDAVIVPKHTVASTKSTWESIAGAVSANGIIITRNSDNAIAGLESAGFDVLDLRNQVLLAVRHIQPTALNDRDALVIQTDQPSASVSSFTDALLAHLQKEAKVANVKVIKLSQLDTMDVKETDICISLLEAESEFLATLGPKDMDRLRSVTDKANDLLWITGADMLGTEPNPSLTLSSGLSRALMLEQPTLRWSVLDLGQQLKDAASVGNLCDNVVKALVTRYDKDDCEFISVNGLLHVSRYSPDFQVNSLFRNRLEPQAGKLEKKTLAEADPARLTISRPGMTDTIHFQEIREPGSSDKPEAGYVDIQVKSVGLNARDVDAMNGRGETREKTTATDFAGIITAIGPQSDTSLKPGDRVVAFAPFHIGTTARVRISCVQKLLDNEDFHTMSNLGVAYGTAIYALKDRANVRQGESVLIHAGHDGFSIASIALAQKLGATVYTTCGSQGKRDYLTRELGVPSSHIFDSRDSSFVQGIAEATGGRGVDVIINSLVGDLLHDSWEKCLADFGRFVEVGKRELLDASRLDMRAFLRGVTFTAFDVTEMFWSKDAHHRANWDRLLVDVLELHRTGEMPVQPAKVFDISQVSQAYRYFATEDRVGNAVIAMDDSESLAPITPAAYSSVFDPEKIYLLIGCLGGLGRSLSRWMVTRGARHFAFLGRSGADKPNAKELVNRLESVGAKVGVVRGDVSQAEDVKAAVAYCVSTGRQIGGVVQAAMGLHEALFTVMPNEAWRTGIDPKFQGTWNLHNALEGCDPDFFLLTSSVSGTVGTATESNYCSANGFLDAFARWRRSQGKACISIGLGMISEVGYLHENPEIEALLLRKGIQPLNEDEFLQVVDLALMSEARGDIKESHMLTGLEPEAIRALSARGFDVTTHGVLVEARSSILLASLQAEQEAADAASNQSQSASAAVAKAAAPWFKDVPAALASSFASEASADSMQIAIVQLIKKRFSNLILIPIDEIDENRAMPEFGVDSMIASEFRSWLWSAFRVDIPFLDIMSPQKSLHIFATSIEAKIQEGTK